MTRTRARRRAVSAFLIPRRRQSGDTATYRNGPKSPYGDSILLPPATASFLFPDLLLHPLKLFPANLASRIPRFEEVLGGFPGNAPPARSSHAAAVLPTQESGNEEAGQQRKRDAHKNGEKTGTPRTHRQHLPLAYGPFRKGLLNVMTLLAAADRIFRSSWSRGHILEERRKAVHLGRRAFTDLLPDLDRHSDFLRIRSEIECLCRMVLQAGLTVGGHRRPHCDEFLRLVVELHEFLTSLVFI